MNKILIGVVIVAVVVLIGFFITVLDAPEPLDEDPVEIAESWVMENASTFVERGGANLEYVESEEVEEGVTEVSFDFEADFEGYGPLAEDEVAAQVITPHNIVVTVENGEITNAITDETYDELEEKMIEEEERDRDQDQEEEVSANLYFYVVEEGVEDLYAVEREFPVPQDMGTYVLNELLEGPTQEEREEGFSTAIDEDTSLISFHVEEGMGYTDFSEELDASGSATVTMIREQIENTLLELENVEDVVISIEGETEGILQP